MGKSLVIAGHCVALYTASLIAVVAISHVVISSIQSQALSGDGAWILVLAVMVLVLVFFLAMRARGNKDLQEQYENNE